LLDQLLARAPNNAAANGNLAAIRSAQGLHEEAEKLLSEVVGVHPDCLCARCNLDNPLIPNGKLDQADELLKGLAARPRIHIQNRFILYGSMALLKRTSGERKVADSLIARLKRMVRNDDGARRLKSAKDCRGRLGVGRMS
jgi:hypothetical protein